MTPTESAMTARIFSSFCRGFNSHHPLQSSPADTCCRRGFCLVRGGRYVVAVRVLVRQRVCHPPAWRPPVRSTEFAPANTNLTRSSHPLSTAPVGSGRGLRLCHNESGSAAEHRRGPVPVPGTNGADQAMRSIWSLFAKSPFGPLQNHMEKVTECVERS